MINEFKLGLNSNLYIHITIMNEREAYLGSDNNGLKSML
jgi:hypothetical protein